ncbi:phosphotransferase [Nocardioides sp. URHA0020]|uniref:phosphotransferase n=1 Tax=Nocardioides sp. URHA0020 TaxID=1380392 RepID=UPI00049092B4|nr:phosphotransferase [Nocardioides sp. URHA0020]
MPRYADIALRLPSTSERWSGDAFRAELTAWIADAVGEPSSLEPVKIRPWATVWRAETPGGVFFAKQNCPTQAHEARLLVALNDLAARHVVPVTAADRDRDLLLTPDQGPVLGESADDDVDTWCRVVAGGAQLQLEVARYADRLAAAGLTTLAPGDCRSYVEVQLDAFAALPAGDRRAMHADDRAAVRALLPAVSAWSEQVGALGLPLTLCHNDLHGRNVFDRGGGLRFFDFADALLMEPLAALLIPINGLAHALDAGPEDPRLHRVADAAVEVWTDYATAAEIRAALPAALQLARLARTESWIRCTAPMDAAELDDWGDAAARWLTSLTRDPLLSA